MAIPPARLAAASLQVRVLGLQTRVDIVAYDWLRPKLVKRASAAICEHRVYVIRRSKDMRAVTGLRNNRSTKNPQPDFNITSSDWLRQRLLCKEPPDLQQAKLQAQLPISRACISSIAPFSGLFCRNLEACMASVSARAGPMQQQGQHSC